MIRPMAAANRRLAPGATGFIVAIAIVLLAVARSVAAAAPTVIVLSLDGLAPASLDAPGLEGLARMRRDGAHAERLVPVFPSLTFPNHVSLATGAPPDVHGIVLNSFRDAVRGRFDYGNDASWIEAEPIWVAAERQGAPSAVYFWVGSETPWHGVSPRYAMRPFDDTISEDAKVEQILRWLDLPEAARPRLVMSWWHGTDRAGHRYGPTHPRVAAQLREQDRALKTLLAGIDARGGFRDTTLLVVSDHGMAEVSQQLAPCAPLRKAGIGCEADSGGGVALLWLADPAQRDAALGLLRGIPGLVAYARDALPSAWRYTRPTRIGDIVVLATPPLALTDDARAASVLGSIVQRLAPPRGGHGYDPARPDMGGVLLALGRGVPSGATLPPARVLDVAATVARLLGIAPPRQNEGRAIEPLGAPPGSARGGGG